MFNYCLNTSTYIFSVPSNVQTLFRIRQIFQISYVQILAFGIPKYAGAYLNNHVYIRYPTIVTNGTVEHHERSNINIDYWYCGDRTRQSDA